MRQGLAAQPEPQTPVPDASRWGGDLQPMIASVEGERKTKPAAERLDEIEKRAKMCGLMSSRSPGGVALMDVAWVIAELRDARAEIHDIQRKRVSETALAYHDRDEARAEAQSHWNDARAYQELYEQQVDALVKVEAELADARAEVERLGKQMAGTVSMLVAERAKVQRVETFLTDAERGDKGRSRVVYCAGVRAALAGGDV